MTPAPCPTPPPVAYLVAGVFALAWGLSLDDPLGTMVLLLGVGFLVVAAGP